MTQVIFNDILIDFNDLDVLERLCTIKKDGYVNMGDRVLRNVLHNKGYITVTEDGKCKATKRLKIDFKDLKERFEKKEEIVDWDGGI